MKNPLVVHDKKCCWCQEVFSGRYCDVFCPKCQGKIDKAWEEQPGVWDKFVNGR